MNAARKRELTSWLDATPDGAAVYGPLGFTPTLQLRRLRLENAKPAEAPPPLSTCSLDEFIARDSRAMGFDRSALLAEFGGRSGSRVLSDGNAMAIVRGGRTARHIGPVLADDPAGALALVHAVVQSETGPLLLDAVSSHDAFVGALIGSGWIIERTVSAHAVWPRHGAGRGAALRGRRPGIRIATMHHSDIKSEVRKLIADGTVLPAHPLALDADRALDTRHQRALTRYYIDAGAGGLAVGVHTTQFAIRDVGLYRPVLELAAETAANWTRRPLAMVAGPRRPDAAGNRRSADRARHRLSCRPAQSCRDEIGVRRRDHRALRGGGRARSRWSASICSRRSAASSSAPISGDALPSIDNVIAIKIAPFNRYRTLDVLRGVAAAGALDRVALYTGNDDHILLDLMLPFDLRDNGVTTRTYFKGGLLGHWSVWTAAPSSSSRCARLRATRTRVPADLLALDARVTDCNSAFFDVANNFHGCIAGCHEVLRRQGLMQGLWCLDPAEGLSPGQMQEIDRVCREHADLSDDAFVAANLQKWLA